jgi:hypothetical protein
MAWIVGTVQNISLEEGCSREIQKFPSWINDGGD